MDKPTAIKALAALAQDGRLEAFRLLVRAGEAGMAAGEIARTLGIAHNTLSSQLSVLANAGLVASSRQGRSIVYRADLLGMQALLSFLLEDCCQGRPESCFRLITSVFPAQPAARRARPRAARAAKG